MFYTYCQNNSGGSFVDDENVTHFVIVEARNADDANQRAQMLGIYFNGTENGQDCECCGDRWYPCAGEGTSEPQVYGDAGIGHALEQVLFLPKACIIYLDGHKEWVGKSERE